VECAETSFHFCTTRFGREIRDASALFTHRSSGRETLRSITIHIEMLTTTARSSHRERTQLDVDGHGEIRRVRVVFRA
jgi:hypothetical protein